MPPLLTSGSIPGGFWQSVNTSIGTIGSFTGDFHGLTLGTDTIIYTVSNGCGSVSTSRVISMKPSPSAILGFPSVCPGSTTTLADTSLGGTWTSPGYSSIATVDAPTGTVTGVAAGSLIVTYTMPNGCSAIITVTVHPLPYSGIVTGPSSVCTNARITLVDTLKGGVWASSAASIASVDTNGIVKRHFRRNGNHQLYHHQPLRNSYNYSPCAHLSSTQPRCYNGPFGYLHSHTGYPERCNNRRGVGAAATQL